MTDFSERPWWRRKRWIAAAVVWLVLAYPLSIGPVVYVAARGWYLPGTEAEIAFAPLLHVLRNPTYRICLPYGAYVRWFETLAERRAATE